MMKLSSRGEYGTRLMIELAENYNTGPVLLKDISYSQDISLKYLGQITILLKTAGLIKSARGPLGGYFLSRPPESIKLISILEATEGLLYLAECVENPESCHRSKDCTVRLVWEKASRRSTSWTTISST